MYIYVFFISFVNAAVAGDDGDNVVAKSNANQGEKNTHRVAKAVSLAQSQKHTFYMIRIRRFRSKWTTSLKSVQLTYIC